MVVNYQDPASSIFVQSAREYFGGSLEMFLPKFFQWIFSYEFDRQLEGPMKKSGYELTVVTVVI